MNRVKDKVCIVTGAANGMGREDALLLAEQGARVVITDINEEAGQKLADEMGAQALFIHHDVASEEGWKNVIDKTLSTFGRLDVLVNNAGILELASIEDTDLALFQKMSRVNSDSIFLGCKYAIEAMKASGGGSIINMSSIAAIAGQSYTCAYSASKGAVAAMTRSVALHCKEKGYGIRCNSVHPDGVDTPMTQKYTGGALSEEVMNDPNNRICHPREIANLVLFLASDESRFINGAELKVDNAQSISGG
ncbi:glucose 1-dehydrogenase [Endozoicomonas numazuensis]|uniref:Short-chain dehydrogenase n=1 Tax=Endozoicomonas numazuensis TaxID=1137799 RepID=A0A081NMF3_9GAMM|nr:glucose 1-dehydrogenase [Endozoicomonas numazuensis]KEQ19626.1 short-chain dehydrogenase [Endozoicomonas numazuensis]